MSYICNGAICISTGFYILSIEANKIDKYICNECKEPVIIKRNNTLSYFCHNKLRLNCTHTQLYNEVNEIHYKDAKYRIKSLLENGYNLYIKRYCKFCSNTEQYKFILSKNDTIILEYKFIIDEQIENIYTADIVINNNNNIKAIINICNTNNLEYKKYNEWFEISVIDILKTKVMYYNVYYKCVKDQCSKCYNDSIKNTVIDI